jgi:Glycosyl transferase family 2
MKTTSVPFLIVTVWMVSLGTILFHHGNLQRSMPLSRYLPVVTLQQPTTTLNASLRHEEQQPQGGLAACLLVRDDNHFLPEWLAYHYFVGPLKSLIVAVDPRSTTDPASILNRYTATDSGLNITVWYNDSFFTKSETKSLQYKRNLPTYEIIQHRTRQCLFYDRCLREHDQAGGRDWTLFIDSDEFVLVNYDMLRATSRSQPRSYTPLSIHEYGSVYHTLQQEQALHAKTFPKTSSPCLQVPRLRYGSVETPDDELELSWPRALPSQSTNTATTGLSPRHLLTHRWRTHANESDSNLNKLSKSIIDLSRIEVNDVPKVTNVHRPIPQYCAKGRLRIKPRDQVRYHFVPHN